MDLMKIGHFLAELRHERKLTQEQLGEILGVTNKTVSRWENGNYLPPVEMLQILSEYYAVSINEILSGERVVKIDDYKEKAEENLKKVLSVSAFTVKDRVEFFKKKWRKENRFTFVLCLIALSVLFAVGVIMENGLQNIAVIAACVYSIVRYNRMMAYVEKNAYDGTGNKKL